MQEFFFDGWDPLLRTLITGVLAYVSMLLMLRISGNRTLSQMNAFDLIVTVGLGSTLATAILSKDVALAQGLLAFGLLIFMQYLLAWAASRSKAAESVLVGEPVLLVHRGRLLEQAMLRTRISEDEIKAAARTAGQPDLGDVEAVVLETNGKLSVVGQPPEDAPSALAAVPRYDTKHPQRP